MKQHVAVDRYARALFKLAHEMNKVAQFGNRLNEVLDVFEHHTELKGILTHPVIKRQDKKDVLRRIFAADVPKELLHFLYLLVDRNREILLPAIVAAYAHLRNQLNQTVVTQVVTATPMYKKSQKLLQDQLEAYLDQKVLMDYHVDTTILGGITVKIGDRLMDASLRTQLHQLAQTLM